MEEKQKSVTMNGLTWGIVAGVLMILYSLILYLLDQSLNTSISWIGYLFFVGAMVWGTLEYRKKELNGYMTYGKAFSTSFMILLFASILVSIYTFLFYQIIAPNLIQDLIETSRQNTRESFPNLSEEEIDKAHQIGSFFRTPILLAITSLFASLLIGSILCLISSTFLARSLNIKGVTINIINKNVSNYINYGTHVTKRTLNLFGFFGILTGWLYVAMYNNLGFRYSYLFLFLIMIIVIGLNYMVYPYGLLVYLVICTLLWANGNEHLKNIISDSKERLNELDKIEQDLLTGDIFLEKGLLKIRVLNEIEGGLFDFSQSLNYSCININLLAFSSVQFATFGMFKESKILIDNAISLTNDDVLLKRLNKFNDSIKKKVESD